MSSERFLITQVRGFRFNEDIFVHDIVKYSLIL